MARNEPEAAKPIVHGALSSYTNGRCRCDECREALKLYMRAYRARKREEEREAA